MVAPALPAPWDAPCPGCGSRLLAVELGGDEARARCLACGWRSAPVAREAGEAVQMVADWVVRGAIAWLREQAKEDAA
jgi:transcription elongation factor Elf1